MVNLYSYIYPTTGIFIKPESESDRIKGFLIITVRLFVFLAIAVQFWNNRIDRFFMLSIMLISALEILFLVKSQIVVPKASPLTYFSDGP